MMKTKFTVRVFLGALLLFCAAPPVSASDFGIVMDISGKAFVQRHDKKISIDLGLNINVGDNIVLGKKAKMLVISYSDCREWTLSGPDNILVKEDGLSSRNHALTPTRQLPVCYSVDEIKKGGSDVVGGFVLRSSEDPLAPLREEFRTGKASNSTLMTLIMYHLNRGEIEKARPYFDTLRTSFPDSAFVKDLSRTFEQKSK